ncbi:MAG TPA: pilus (MSHA type) biogenesis protein MshL [Cellvibrio sp.]|nr:pilus (MSHA type) biogenesis protein MshL [Cellvibrio sp.]
MFTNPEKISSQSTRQPAVIAHKVQVTVLFFASLLMLSSCTPTDKSDRRLATEDAIDEVVKQQNEQPASTKNVPAEVNKALLNNQTLASGGLAKNSSERFDVSVNNVAAKAFFLGLVNGTGVNVVVHPEVSGTVTLDLKNVTVDDVLRVTRDIYGYEFKRDRGIYTIYSNAMRTQVFPINYLDVQRVGVSDTSVLIGRAPTSNDDSSGSGGGGNTTSENANLLSMIQTAEQQKGGGGVELSPGSRVQTLNRTDFWASLENTLISIIGGETESRSVMMSPQAGMVVVKAMPHELNAVRDFLERSQLSIKRQVILEAKILEVRLSEGFEAGVNWNAISGQLIATKNVQDGYPINTDGSSALVGEFRPVPDPLLYGSKISTTVAGLIQVTDITQLLSLLETQGAVQVLSSPRVSTVNNQKAVIRVGSDEYFVTGISSDNTSTAASVTSTPNIELTPFFSGISLDVTPQISDTGEVILHIHPVVSNVEDQQKVFTVGDEEFALPLALRGIRESDSIVKAANGQVIVLGGLMTEYSDDKDGKRPWIGEIPVVNTLFKTKSKVGLKTELVILLRPIVVDDKVWDDQVNEAQSNMQRMGDAYRSQW